LTLEGLHAYRGIGFCTSVPLVPSPKLTVPDWLEVKDAFKGAAPEVGETVREGVLLTVPEEVTVTTACVAHVARPATSGHE